ncbi:hypothetical protein [Modestobacter sp. DSM 44400]|uniref:hypothetical protein n=1 Tax=Modestobacter sp. DSM 44400 TaxID=1550230 RepID=UPI001C3157E3|nr:hypothetical protein [Modestobacter sp. DSM 44400]
MNVELYTDVDERLDLPVMLPPNLDRVDLTGAYVLIADDLTGRPCRRSSTGGAARGTDPRRCPARPSGRPAAECADCPVPAASSAPQPVTSR